MIFALVGCAFQKFQLLAVAPAPSTKKKMDAKANALKKCQSAVHAFGLQPGCLLAAWGKERDNPGESFDRRAG